MVGLASSRRLLRSRAGTTAVEFALIGLPFVMLIFGTVEFSRLIWTQSALQFAVERAARCAAVNTLVCGTLSQIQQYAGSQMLAPGVPNSSFSYSLPSCGKQVSAAVQFVFLASSFLPSSVTLSARSCYPA